jgi:hypothetical protein
MSLRVFVNVSGCARARACVCVRACVFVFVRARTRARGRAQATSARTSSIRCTSWPRASDPIAVPSPHGKQARAGRIARDTCPALRVASRRAA